jgi:hypothetical protein
MMIVKDDGAAAGTRARESTGRYMTQSIVTHNYQIQCEYGPALISRLDMEAAMQIEIAKRVAAPPPKVFDIIADATHWPQIMRSVVAVEVLTRGPLRVGTRLREIHVMFGQQTTEELEVVEMERPRRLRLAGQNHGLRYERDHIIDALDIGSRLMLVFRTKPQAQDQTGRALMDFIAPYMEVNLRDELESDLADLAAAVTRMAA